jgi:hypothetical protein
MEGDQGKEGTMSDEQLEGDLGREEVDAHKEPERTDEPGDELKNEPKTEGSGAPAPTEEIHMPLSWSVPRAPEESRTPEPGKVDQNAETKKWPLDPVPEREVPLVEVPSGESPEEPGPEAVEPAPVPEASKAPKKKRARRKKPARKRTDKARRKPAKRKAGKAPAKRPAKKRKKSRV